MSGKRFYSPEIGRWASRDPTEEDGGSSLAAFVGNNPVDLLDPRSDPHRDPGHALIEFDFPWCPGGYIRITRFEGLNIDGEFLLGGFPEMFSSLFGGEAGCWGFAIKKPLIGVETQKLKGSFCAKILPVLGESVKGSVDDWLESLGPWPRRKSKECSPGCCDVNWEWYSPVWTTIEGEAKCMTCTFRFTAEGSSLVAARGGTCR